MPSTAREKQAWVDFLVPTPDDLPITFAVSLAYNNRWGGTACPTYRIVPDTGECIRLPTPRVPVASGANRLPIIRTVRLDQVHADLDWLHGLVDRDLYGRKFHLRTQDERSSFLGFIEHPKENLHVHLHWRVPERDIAQFVDTLGQHWKRITKYGSLDVKPVRDAGWAWYSLEEQWGSALDEAELFVSSRSLTR